MNFCLVEETLGVHLSSCTVQADELLDIRLQRSGNPGYVDGEPLLAGVLIDEYP